MTPVMPNSRHDDAVANTSPSNATTVDSATTFTAPGISSSATGASAAATLGSVHPDPVPEKLQDSIIPPREQTYLSPHSVHEEALKYNKPSYSSLQQEAEQAFPHSDYSRKERFFQGETSPKCEPDKDLQSMFLRYDNRLNRKRYFFRCLVLGAAVSIITKLITMIAVSMNSSTISTLGTIISIVAIISSSMLIIRRLHDLNRPAWWCIGVFVPLVNLVLGIYLLFFKGTDGPNDYVPDPLEVPDGLL